MMNQQRISGQGPVTAPSTPVLTDPKLVACRDMALQLLLQSFDGFFDHLEEEFLELAENSVDRSLRDTYFAARAETMTKRELIKNEFRQRFLEGFNTRLSEMTGDQRKARSIKLKVPASELSLVANEEYEENLTAGNMATTFTRMSGEDLKQLESRFASLLPRSEDDEAANPISPEAISEAMLGACRQIESGVDARIVALRSFEHQLTSQVAGIYRQVNEFLVQQNVQPVVHQFRPRNASSSRPQQSAQEAPPTDSDLPSQAQRQAGPAAYGDAPQYAPQDLPPGMVQMTIPAALASHLESLLNGQVPMVAEEAHIVRSSETAFLNQLQHRLPDSAEIADNVAMHPGRDNLVSLLQNTQWGQNLAQVDAMTLNLVALLFDRVFEDSRLPVAIKGLIGRLQIPVLKVALIDNTFFARKNHPARQLLDRLAESAVDWHEGADAGNPRFDKLSAIVSWVVVNFEDDVSIFEQALEDLESFLLAEADAAASQVLEDTEELAASELSELGLATADSIIKGRLFKRETVPLVNEFIETWWNKTLACAYGPAGENEPRFVAYVAVLDDLLWSVEPKRGPEERLQLINRLPAMLKTLEDGANLSGMPAEECKAFFAELVHCHATAIRNGMRQASMPEPVAAVPPVETGDTNAEAHPPSPVSPPPVTIRPTVAAMTEASRQNLANHGIDLGQDENTDQESNPAFEMPAPSNDELPKRWEWVQLLKNDGSILKLRLTWVSPQGTRFLFTNREGQNGHTFNLAEVKKLMQAGRMQREVLASGLTDDVFNQLRQTLVVN